MQRDQRADAQRISSHAEDNSVDVNQLETLINLDQRMGILPFQPPADRISSDALKPHFKLGSPTSIRLGLIPIRPGA